MVEMLGVLAIIGVLSIGGIAGYTYAMDKRKANDIVNEVNKRAVVAASQRITGRTVDLSEFDDYVYPITSVDADYDDEFGIQVSDVPEGVCDRILDINWPTPSEILPTSCGETNTMTFYFNEDLSLTCMTDDDCGYCQHCDNAKCVPDDMCENNCSGNTPVLTKVGTCIACPSFKSTTDVLSYKGASEAECQKCEGFIWNGSRCIFPEDTDCPEGFFRAGGPNEIGTCYSCDSQEKPGADAPEKIQACLEACPNRIFNYENSTCSLPCDGFGQFVDSWGYCRTCGVNLDYWDPYWGDCSMCDGTGYSYSLYDYGDECVIDCPDLNYGRNVYRCCNDNEVYTDIGYSSYGHQYGACCPKSRPVWDGSACQPEE